MESKNSRTIVYLHFYFYDIVMTLLVKWEKDQPKNIVEQKNHFLLFEIRSKACWVHDSNEDCVFVEFLIGENVFVGWVIDKTKNTVTEDDLMIDSDAEIGFWRMISD